MLTGVLSSNKKSKYNKNNIWLEEYQNSITATKQEFINITTDEVKGAINKFNN